MDHKAPDAFRTISEVADELDLPQHVLRFWESRFSDIKPMKRGGGRRYYRPDDIDLLRGIRHLLYGEGYTIRGVQRILREQGARFVTVVWQEGAPQPPHVAGEDEDAAVEATPAEAVEEERSIRERLSALIGRDLGDRDAAQRADPPLQSAPVPRIDPEDRAIYHAPPVPVAEAMPEPEPLPSPAPAIPIEMARTAPVQIGRLGRDDVRKLHAVLHELGECRKLLDAALAKAA